MNSQDLFGAVAIFYAVSNLASMGLEINLRETIRSLRSARILGLTLGWSWVIGPAFAVLLTKVLPLSASYAMMRLLAAATRQNRLTSAFAIYSNTTRCEGIRDLSMNDTDKSIDNCHCRRAKKMKDEIDELF